MGVDPMDKDSRPTLGDVNGKDGANNIDAIILFNFVLGSISAPSHMERSDVKSDASINNVDAVILFNWVLGAAPIIPI